jgi:hypothetical protein
MTGNLKKGGGMFDVFSSKNKYIHIKTVDELIESIEDPDSGKDTIVTHRGVSKKQFGTPEYYPQYMVGDSEFSKSYWGVRVTKDGKYYLQFQSDKDKIDLKTTNEIDALKKDISKHNIRMTKNSKDKYDEVKAKKASDPQQSAGKKRRTKKRKSMKKKQRKTKKRKSLKKRKSIKKRKA